MAATNHTANFSLPQWEATDPVLRTDFNAAFSAIDTALADGSVCHIETGSYTGTGTWGYNNKTTLTFSFSPKLVVLFDTTLKEAAFFLPGASQYARTLNSAGATLTYGAASTLEGDTLSIWVIDENDKSQQQGNALNRSYLWIALG
jgi:hypothetical protein